MFDCQRDPEGMFDYLPDLWSKFGVVCVCMCGTPVAPQSFHGFLDSLRNQTICGEKARYVWCFCSSTVIFSNFQVTSITVLVAPQHLSREARLV